MNYLTNYYKNRCTQLQEQVSRLSNRIRLLSEDDTYAGEAQQAPSGNTSENPWLEPAWTVPPLDPNQSPVRPPNQGEWERNNPKPNPNNYPGGERDAEYQRDLARWYDAYTRAFLNYMAWYRYMRGLNRITGQGKDREWELPRFRDPEIIN
jgi:hypothetical protein